MDAEDASPWPAELQELVGLAPVAECLAALGIDSLDSFAEEFDLEEDHEATVQATIAALPAKPKKARQQRNRAQQAFAGLVMWLRAYEEFDADDNGFLSRVECLRIPPERMRAKAGGTIAEHFDAIDTDRDGNITFAELFVAAELVEQAEIGVPPSPAQRPEPESDEAMIQLWVKAPDGATLKVMAADGLATTVAQIRSAAAAAARLDVSSCRLIFAGRELEDRMSLAEYNCENASELHLILRVEEEEDMSIDREVEQQTASVRAELVGKKLADFIVSKKVGGKDISVVGGAAAQTISQSGVCSYVYLAVLRAGRGSGPTMQFAIKVMLNYEEGMGNSVAIRREFDAETTLLSDPERLPAHRHVMVVLHSFTDTAAGLPSWNFEPDIVNPRTMFVVMPYYPDDLKRVLRLARRQGSRVFGTLRAVRIVSHLLQAVRHLKSHGIVHRDVKLDNVMIASPGTPMEAAVLTDFGMCLDLTKNCIVDFRVPMPVDGYRRGGAPIALAPEVTLPEPGPDVFLDYSKNDEWAVGMVAHQLLSQEGCSPFSDMDHPTTYSDAGYQEETIPQACRSFVSGLLRIAVSNRLNAIEGCRRAKRLERAVSEDADIAAAEAGARARAAAEEEAASLALARRLQEEEDARARGVRVQHEPEASGQPDPETEPSNAVPKLTNEMIREAVRAFCEEGGGEDKAASLQSAGEQQPTLDPNRPTRMLPCALESATYMHADSLLRSSWAKRDTYEFLRLVEVMEVDNPRLHRRYEQYKQGLPEKGNEQLVFHGCSESVAESIVEQGLLRKFWESAAGERQRFGAGFYFALQASKSHEYPLGSMAALAAGEHSRTMILCKVAKGKVFQTRMNMEHLSGAAPDGYHSIHGISEDEGALDFDELVVYNEAAILPYAVVKYQFIKRTELTKSREGHEEWLEEECAKIAVAAKNPQRGTQNEGIPPQARYGSYGERSIQALLVQTDLVKEKQIMVMDAKDLSAVKQKIAERLLFPQSDAEHLQLFSLNTNADVTTLDDLGEKVKLQVTVAADFMPAGMVVPPAVPAEPTPEPQPSAPLCRGTENDSNRFVALAADLLAEARKDEQYYLYMRHFFMSRRRGVAMERRVADYRAGRLEVVKEIFGWLEPYDWLKAWETDLKQQAAGEDDPALAFDSLFETENTEQDLFPEDDGSSEVDWSSEDDSSEDDSSEDDSSEDDAAELSEYTLATEIQNTGHVQLGGKGAFIAVVMCFEGDVLRLIPTEGVGAGVAIREWSPRITGCTVQEPHKLRSIKGNNAAPSAHQLRLDLASGVRDDYGNSTYIICVSSAFAADAWKRTLQRYELFVVQQQHLKHKTAPEFVHLQVNRSGVKLMNPFTQRVYDHYRFQRIRGWKADKGARKLHLRVSRDPEFHSGGDPQNPQTPYAFCLETARSTEIWDLLTSTASEKDAITKRHRERLDAIATGKQNKIEVVRCQYGGKGNMEPVMMELAGDKLFMMSHLRLTIAKTIGSAKFSQPKKARKGAPHTLCVNLPTLHPDNECNVKYILSFQSAKSLSEWKDLFASV